MGTLALLDKNKKFHSDVVNLILDKSTVSRYKTIIDYAKDNKQAIDKDELKQFIKKVEKSIYDQVVYYAHLMYHYMEVSGDWGEAGEQQVKITFCRNLLKIDPKHHLEPQHATEFQKKVSTTIQSLKINTLTADAAKDQLRHFKFNIFGLSIEVYKSAELNRMLKFTGSKTFIHTGQFGSQMEIIFGSGTSKDYHGYHIITVKKEHIRTPNNVMSMAAIIGHQNIYIRMESLTTIFAQKWMQIFDYSDIELLTIHSNDFWNIAEGIKQKVLEYYGIESKEELLESESVFIKDMSETILHHELGHGIVQHDILPFEIGAIGEASKIYGENIYTAILEFLADFSPNRGKLKGPIQNIIEISKTDRNRAKRMYFMYLSDIWFYNTDDTYMYTYSDLMTLILIRYIQANDIQFERLEKELIHNPKNTKNPSHFDRICQLYTADILELKAMCENASFKTTGDSTMNYQKIRQYLIDEFKKNDGFVHVDTYEFLVPYWSNILGYVQSISDSDQLVKDFMTQQQEKILKKIMILSGGKETATKYSFNHRQYIIDRMSKLNMLAIDTR